MKKLKVSVDLLESLVDSGNCWYDHHGGCQEHGYISLQPGELCPHYEAKQILAKHYEKEAAKNDKDSN
jgi:hypothetical protein